MRTRMHFKLLTASESFAASIKVTFVRLLAGMGSEMDD